jgi:hypothetical protein
MDGTAQHVFGELPECHRRKRLPLLQVSDHLRTKESRKNEFTVVA